MGNLVGVVMLVSLFAVARQWWRAVPPPGLVVAPFVLVLVPSALALQLLITRHPQTPPGNT